MDALRLPSLSVPTVRLPGQTRQPDTGNYIVVTSNAYNVKITLNGVEKTYSVTPNEPTKIYIGEKVTSLYKGFAQSGATYIDLSNLNTSEVESMQQLFSNNYNLFGADLSGVDTHKVRDMSFVFYGAPNLILPDLSSFDISNAKSLRYMFTGNRSRFLDISNFNFEAAIDVSHIFDGCPNLTDLKFGYNLKVSIDFSSCPLTHESALSVINGLAEGTTSKAVTFKATAYNTLTDEEIALATSKGWTIVSA